MMVSNKAKASGAGWIVGALIGVVVAALSGCDARSDAMMLPPPPEVDVAQVLAEPVTIWDALIGRVAAPETVDLRPRVSGYIDEVAFTEGALVHEGDLLFRIDPRPYQALLQTARAEQSRARSQLAQAESEAGRATQLLESRAISREEYDQRRTALLAAQAQLEAANAAVERAQLDVTYTRITAPVTGRVGRAMVTRGNLASADQTLLTTLVSVDPVHVYFDSDEQAALQRAALLTDTGPVPVRIGLAGEDGLPHRGELDFVDNQVNAGTGTLRYRAVLPNPDGVFRPGQFARVQMPLAYLDNALLVHRRAVMTDQDRRFVYVVDDDNLTVRRQVVTGRPVDELLVIQEGLERGDRVIVSGAIKVYGSGMEVVPRQVAMRDAGVESDVALNAAQH
ncbi:efflux RND transporter periplasmic adaptor subunit [Isoalcanivorax indicus]|uniref:efflux RND transporter periplasmic adaptor subunit n=1 Tax=Isoalcanivorax indicus TaxID=2202653 RepID=UPI00319DC403